jgi:hypothetical protein
VRLDGSGKGLRVLMLERIIFEIFFRGFTLFFKYKGYIFSLY